ncbi:TPA: hypothetical protein MJE50_00740 [Klebsiella pneumoniae]|nr:hypothetical protein [Klebsiella pneumoniae]
MSTLLTIPDTAELLAHTITALKAAGYASAAMIPVHKNASNEVEKTEVTAPEVYVAPGQQYANARDALAHMVHELKNPDRNNYNETLDFTYATLAQLLDMLRDPIYQHGLMLNQELVHADNATGSLPFNMVTTFHHNPTGTEVSFTLPAYIKQDKRLDACQQFGATYTYYRRYGLRQALDITDGDDDIDQADSKRERRKARALNSSRKWKPTKSERTKAESILNMLVAAGEFTGSAVIAQAKARNPFLRTPSEVAEDVIHSRDNAKDDDAMARDTVLRYGLTDEHWQSFYKQAGFFQVDGDELIDTRTGAHVSAEVAMDIAESLSSVAISSADSNDVHDTRDMSAPVARTFIPDCTPLDDDEEAFVAAVEAGHDSEIIEIAMRQMEVHVSHGLDMRSVHSDTSYHRRNWYNACREFYTLALMRGDVNFEALANPEMKVARTIMDIVGADGDNEASETTIAAAQTQLTVDEMQQKVDIAQEIATGNADTDIKLQQLHEIARRCDAYTSGYIETLILHVESGGFNSEIPPYIPESDLPY